MNIADICNITAWVLCAVVAFLLLRDFVRTEIHFLQEKKEQAAQAAEQEGSEDGTAE